MGTQEARNLLQIISKIKADFADLRCTLMEVCGTHTNVIRKAGIHRLLPPKVRLLSGPGCPVCVTGSGYIEQSIVLSRTPRVVIATFGDLLKVPGNTGTLSGARAAKNSGKIQVVYSPIDAVEIAEANPDAEVVFLGVGFETTAPVIALAVKEAMQKGIRNFSVLPALKILNPALKALLADPDLALNGLIAPGHLSVITGADALAFVPGEYRLPTVITGFKIEELWLGIAALLKQCATGVARLENMYSHAVTREGNQAAQALVHEVFSPEDTEWRGLGMIKGSGFGFSDSFEEFDARRRFKIESIESVEPPGCKCGLILLGKYVPEECPHFGRGCTPESPIGPCMVSAEGVCAAHFYYRDRS